MILKLTLLLIGCVSLSHGKALDSKQTTKKPFEFDDVINSGRFGSRGFPGTWISANEFTYTNNGNFVKYNVDTNTNETILSQEYILGKSWSGPSFQFSADRTRILVRYARRSIFRHSSVSRFSVITLPLDITEEPMMIALGSEVQTAFFAPDGTGVAYIKDNNIVYVDLGFLPTDIAITTDGVPDLIYNGIPDWVYEEEVLGSDAASWFSPDGTKLAYIRFDDTHVKEATYDLYGEGDQQYPNEVHLRYPKAGTTNPTIALRIYNIETSVTTELSVPTDKVTADHILGTVFWINQMTLGAIWMNRRQDLGVFVTYDAATFARNEIFEINEPNGWIDVNTPKCDANSNCYFVNNNANWPAVLKLNAISREYLTATGLTVRSIYGVTDAGNIFYMANPAGQPWNRHVYSNEGCLTCSLQTPEGNSCSYASASFSKDMSRFSMSCSGPDPNFVKIYKSDVFPAEEILDWEKNENLRLLIADQDLPKVSFLRVPVGGGFEAAVRIRLPSSINLDATTFDKKYALIVNVYAGPGSTGVSNGFTLGFPAYQITKKEIIYVDIDGRGSALKGTDMMFSVNNRLGTYEMEDQIAVTKFLINKYKFIDPTRVGIWGWSYGGYATAMTLAQDTEKVFKCGISVASVTSWRFYDTIYTERYMGINSNALQYNTSDVSTPEHVKVLGQHDFFLIHGNADDNVHYQQSMVLARQLELADIQFEQLSYPNEAHGISGTQPHLYHAMDRFWDKCFKEPTNSSKKKH